MDTRIEYRLDPADVGVAYRCSQRRLLNSPELKRPRQGLALLFGLVWMGVGVWASRFVGVAPFALIGLGIALMLIGIQQWAVRRLILLALTSPLSGNCGERRLSVENDGVRVEYPGGDLFAAWPSVTGVEELGATLVLNLDGYRALPVPQAAFADQEALASFVRLINSRIGRDLGASMPGMACPARGESVQAGGRDPESLPGDLWCNLKQGLRYSLFRAPGSVAAPASWSQLVILVGLGVVLHSLLDLAKVAGAASFSSYALPYALFHVPVMLLAAWAAALLAGRSERTLVLLVAFVALSIPIEMLWLTLNMLFGERLAGLPVSLKWFWFYAPFAWIAMAAAVAAIRSEGVDRRRWAPIIFVVSLILVWPLAQNQYGTALWHEAYDEDAEAERQKKQLGVASEDALYLQPKLLAQELAAIQPGKKGVIDLFVVGAAGDASQDVFMKEAHTVRDLFVERFGAQGHTATLINNAQTLASSPIASATALEQTLRRVGEVMDRDEDMLFLFLTSHGSPQHRFYLNFRPLRFNTLDPQRLRQMLDASGIKRRVIVVSACYSGGYIDALKDDHTLIVTSAAADRTSFGCSNEAEFTYFGKAYFDEALRQTYSFVEAFDIARQHVAAREKADGYESSDPRMAIGKEMPAILDEFVRQRTARQEAASAAERPRPGRRAKYDDLFDMLGLDEQLRESSRLCHLEVQSAAPETMIKKQPGYYGGLTPDSPYWPKLVAAWQRYEDEVCRHGISDPVVRDIYRAVWQSQLAEGDVSKVMALFRTPVGASWLAASKDAVPKVATRLAELRAPLVQKAMQRLQADMGEVVGEFQGDAERRRAGSASR